MDGETSASTKIAGLFCSWLGSVMGVFVAKSGTAENTESVGCCNVGSAGS